ncbi:MAG: hypothetical protein PUF10_02890 [Bacteroidales bacterium]|nr:hypothetical protein [Bacteroidales bacterium]
MSCANDNAKRQTYFWAKRMAEIKSSMDTGHPYIVYRESANIYGNEVYNCCREEDYTPERGVQIEVVQNH